MYEDLIIKHYQGILISLQVQKISIHLLYIIFLSFVISTRTFPLANSRLKYIFSIAFTYKNIFTLMQSYDHVISRKEFSFVLKPANIAPVQNKFSPFTLLLKAIYWKSKIKQGTSILKKEKQVHQ